LPAQHKNSYPIPPRTFYQIDKNLLQRTFAGMQIAKINAMLIQLPQHLGNSGCFTLHIKGEGQRLAIVGQRQGMATQRLRYCFQWLL
tara:strand:- start:129271 stop:129531 length:261 start_codon:yes stop_codon:yes gene_type:complete